MAVKFSNNGKTTLSAGITSSATSISVTDGSVFPTLGSGDSFYMTLEDGSGNNEIVSVTAVSTNTLTVTRAQEGTTARAFSSGDKAENRLTAAGLNSFVSDAGGDTITGDLTFDGGDFIFNGQYNDRVLMLDYSTGRVGINLGSGNTPSNTLHIKGGQRWEDTSAGNILELQHYSGFSRIYRSNGDLRIKAGGASGSDYLEFSNSGGFTYAGNDIWHAGNDGSGSGLDADTLDGIQASSFLRSDADDTFSGALSVTSGSDPATITLRQTGNTNGLILKNYNGDEAQIVNADNGPVVIKTNDAEAARFTQNKQLQFTQNNVQAPTSSDATTGARLILYPLSSGRDYSIGIESSTMWFNSDDNYKWYVDGAKKFEWDNTAGQFEIGGNKVWHAGNDGSGSGLDADTLDGQHGSYYQPAASELSWIDQATGDYGTVKVDDDRGVSWAGYAIRDDWVFMSNGADNVGIYNDTNNEWAIQAHNNAHVSLYYNGGAKFATNASGVRVYSSASNADNTTATYEKGITITGGNQRLNIDVSSTSNGGAYLQTRHSSTTYPTAYYQLKLNPLGGAVSINGHTAWHAGNDGSGSGLDADKLEGYHASTTRNAANTIPIRDQYGYLNLGWINTTSGSTTNTINKIYASSDDYIRYVTPATLISQLGLWTSGNDGSGSGLDADTLDGYHKTNLQNNTSTSFYVAGQADRFYKVSINVSNVDGLRVYRPYSATIGGSSSYWNNGSSTHFGALSLDLRILRNDWGGHRSRLVGTCSHNYTVVCARAAMGQSSEHTKVIMYLRGGAGGSGAIYYLTTDSHAATVSVDYNSYLTAADAEFNSAYLNRFINPHGLDHYTLKVSGSQVWHPGNDGSGSGLDADTLDGYHVNSNDRNNEASKIVRTQANGRIYGGQFYANDWFRVEGDQGVYWQGRSRGITSPEQAGNAYSSVTTYGTGRNSWQGWGIQDAFAFMGRSGTDVGVHDNGFGWAWYWNITNDGLGIGTSTTSSSYRLYVNGAIYATDNITAYSDRRAKENIVTIDNALDKVNALRGVYYNKRFGEDKPREVGVIAQEVQEVVPELVTYAEDVDEYGVKYANTVGLLIEAIKELTAKVQELETKCQ